MASPWLRTLLLLLLAVPLTACGDMSRPFSPKEPHQPIPPQAKGPRERRAQSQAQRQRIEQERCLRERPGLEAQMVALRQAERQLARVKQDTYVPLPRPEGWDEAKESRYRLEDREADWQRHLQIHAEWQRREEGHRMRWQADHNARLRMAQGKLDALARQLQDQRPDLFTGPGSIEFNPEAAARIRTCRTEARGQPTNRRGSGLVV